ncbi:yceI [Symbiodinium sp. CCMP2592]|nr:yceI [Symbiodinium sp. CCMP2592]
MKKAHTLIASTIGLAAIGAGLAGFTSSANEASNAILETSVESVAAESYAVDAVHSTVLFKIRHGGVSNFYGRFNKLNGTIEFDKSDVASSSMSFTIPASSVDTNNKDRDDHVKNAEFFNARQYPEISFESTSISEVSDGVYALSGNLSFHGETKEITADLTEVRTGTFRGKPVMGFEASFSIKRSDYGITKYLAEDLSDNGPLGNTVEITVAIEAVKQ